MSATVPRSELLTAEAFLQWPNPPDGSLQELVNGRIETIPPPTIPHGYISSRIVRKLGGFVEANGLGWVTSNNAGVILARNPDTVRGPDIAYWSYSRLPILPNVYTEVAPDLTVDVVTSIGRCNRILRKINDYLNAGAHMIWLIDPAEKTVSVWGPDRIHRLLEETDTLDGGDVLPGFHIPLAELFDPPPRKSFAVTGESV